MKSRALPWVPRKCLHKNPSPYTDTPYLELFHLTMLAWNLNLHLRFRFRFSSRPAGILFPLKVVLLLLIILIILSSRSHWTLPLQESSSGCKKVKKSLEDSFEKIAACFVCSSSS